MSISLAQCKAVQSAVTYRLKEIGAPFGTCFHNYQLRIGNVGNYIMAFKVSAYKQFK